RSTLFPYTTLFRSSRRRIQGPQNQVFFAQKNLVFQTSNSRGLVSAPRRKRGSEDKRSAYPRPTDWSIPARPSSKLIRHITTRLTGTRMSGARVVNEK